MATTPRSPISAEFHPTRWEPRVYAGGLDQASRVRKHIRTDLSGFPDDTVDTVQLCCSELFANAVNYTASGAEGGEVVRRLCRPHPDQLRLEITDGGWTDRRPTVPIHRTSTEWAGAEGQRGLLLVASCATAWGYLPVIDHPGFNLGLRVWAEFPLDARAAPPLDRYVFTTG